MGIFSSEPDVLNTQESIPSNLIGSSVLGRDSAAIGTCTSTSSLVHGSSPVRFGTLTPPAPSVFGAPTTSASESNASATTSTFGSTRAPSSWIFSSPTTSAFGSTKAPTFGSCAFAAPTTSTYRSIQAPAFGSGAFSAPTPSIFASTEPPAFGSGPFAAPTPSAFGSTTFGSTKASPFGSGPFDASTPSPFGSTTFGSRKASPFGSGPFDAATPSAFGSTTFESTKASPFGSYPFSAPIFGSGASATSTSSTSSPFHGSSLFGSVPAVTSVTSAPTQPLAPTAFGHSAFSVPRRPRFESVPAPVQTSASFSFGPAQDCGKTASASQVFASNGWSSHHGTEQSSKKYPPRYAPTLDGEGIYVSVSATNSYPHKRHEELRWEDYQKGNKGVSSPASGCTACGAMTSSSVSGHLTFNGATIPPSAATSLSGFFFSTSGSCPMIFGTTNLAAQGTTTSAPLQAYPVHGFVLLPSSAMNTLK